MSIVEAYSVGTPVICSDLGNTGSIVQEGITGCKFRAGSVEKLRDAIRRLATYEHIYDTTYREFEMKYTEEKNYEMLLRIYESV